MNNTQTPQQKETLFGRHAIQRISTFLAPTEETILQVENTIGQTTLKIDFSIHGDVPEEIQYAIAGVLGRVSPKALLNPERIINELPKDICEPYFEERPSVFIESLVEQVVQLHKKLRGQGWEFSIFLDREQGALVVDNVFSHGNQDLIYICSHSCGVRELRESLVRLLGSCTHNYRVLLGKGEK